MRMCVEGEKLTLSLIHLRLYLSDMPSSSTITTSSKSKIKSSLPSSTYKILTATVIRIYLSRGATDSWNYSGLEGAIAFVKDNSKNTFAFKLIDLKVRFYFYMLYSITRTKRESLMDDPSGPCPYLPLLLFLFRSQGTRGIIWEHELYNNFVLNQDRTFFHSFEGDVSFNHSSLTSTSVLVEARRRSTESIKHLVSFCEQGLEISQDKHLLLDRMVAFRRESFTEHGRAIRIAA